MKLKKHKWEWRERERDAKEMRVGGRENSFRSSARITIRFLEMINSDSSIPQGEMNKYEEHPTTSRCEALDRQPLVDRTLQLPRRQR